MTTMHNPNLLGGTMMTPIERMQGRFLRAPDHPAPADGAGTADNSGVTAPPANQQESLANNSGQTLDPAAFWAAGDEPDDSAAAATEAQQLGNQLTTALSSMTFGANIVDEALAAEMAEGRFDNFNAKLVEHGRQIARQSLGLSVQVMKAFEGQMQTKVQQMIQEAMGSRDQQADLFAAIPSAKNPAVRPHIERIYQQALKVSKGDSKAAIEMTKSMARMMAETAAPDLGLNLAPGNPSESAPAPVNWLEELMTKQ